jgi:type I restriction enzyme M protein
LLEFVNDALFVDLKNLIAPIDKNPRGFVVKAAFSDAFNYMKNGTLLRQVINKLNEIDFTDSNERHLFGDIYEQILRDLQSAGNAGEFYTPRAVTSFMVNRIDPKLGESVMDPACGTGGFLACSFDHVKDNYVRSAQDHQTLQQQIHGVEKKQLPHLLCTTNMLLHGIEVPVQIRHGNTLNKPLSSWDESVDVIVTNPPFGGNEEDGIEKNFPAEFQTRDTADLFLQLIVEVLAPNGRAAVVLPDGTLFGEGVKTKIKKLLTEECNLHTIVRLPNGVFSPYTGIKTNILFFTKGQPTKDIWFYEHPYPEGVKNYNKTKPMRFEEFQTEIAWWGDEADGFAARVETEQAWKVGIDEIIGRNFNLDIKNPHVGELISHDPDQLLADFAEQQQQIGELRDQLKSILGDALGKGAL